MGVSVLIGLTKLFQLCVCDGACWSVCRNRSTLVINIRMM